MWREKTRKKEGEDPTVGKSTEETGEKSARERGTKRRSIGTGGGGDAKCTKMRERHESKQEK